MPKILAADVSVAVIEATLKDEVDPEEGAACEWRGCQWKRFENTLAACRGGREDDAIDEPEIESAAAMSRESGIAYSIRQMQQAVEQGLLPDCLSFVRTHRQYVASISDPATR